MPPTTLRYSGRRRALVVAYVVFCWFAAAVFFALTSAVPEVAVVLRSGGGFLVVWSLVTLWLSFASVQVDQTGITQCWPGGLRNRIPWSKVTEVAVVHRPGRKARRQIKVTLTNGRAQHLLAPVDGLPRPTNPAFDQEAAAVLDAWEWANPPLPGGRCRDDQHRAGRVVDGGGADRAEQQPAEPPVPPRPEH
jgi:hypothetical protein